MAVYEFIQYDTASMEVTISDRNGVVALSAPGTAVRFAMAKVDDPLVISGECSIVDDGSAAKRGKVRYDWLPGETDSPGVYRAQFRYTSPAGVVKHFPNDGWEDVIIHPAVAP